MIPPACEKEGMLAHYVCDECGKCFDEDKREISEDDLVIAAVGHDWDAGVVTKEPFYSVEGERTYTCSKCGATRKEIIPQLTESEGLRFEVKTEGCKLLGIGSCMDGVVIIPERYADLPVTEIAPYAFSRCSQLKAVVIPGSVKLIGGSSFQMCDGLTLVRIMEGVTEIAEYAFYGCGSLQTLSVPDSLTIIGKSAFCDCKSLTALSGGSGLTRIEDNAFSGCAELRLVTLSESITSIGRDVFFGCSSLEEMTVPFVGDHEVTSTIWDRTENVYPFGYFFGMRKYEGSKEVYMYKSEKGNYGSALYYVPISLRRVTVLRGVIGPRCFSGCELTSVTLGKDVINIGEQAFYGCWNLSSLSIGDGVAEIAPGAFYRTSLQAITVAEGNPVYYSEGNCVIERETKVLILGGSASEIPADGSVNTIGCGAFGYRWGLASLVIPDPVTSIGSFAFADCYDLISITLPSSLLTVSPSAFLGCRSLVEIYNRSDLNIEKGSDTYGEVARYAGAVYREAYTSKLSVDEEGYALYTEGDSVSLVSCPWGKSELTIPANVTEIGFRAFTYCEKLITVNFAEGSRLTRIGDEAFYYCVGLTSITIPKSLKSIGDFAFYRCAKLTSITIPDGVTSIGDGAFEYCSGLTSISIPEGVTSIGDYAFCCCRSLTSVTLPNGLKSIGKYAFDECSSLASITIPEGVTSIGDGAFASCSGLISITLPSGVKSVGRGAFSDCSALQYGEYEGGLYLGNDENPYFTLIRAKSIDITQCEIHPDTNTIDADAFSRCRNLVSVTIPKGVTKIGDNAFYGCRNFTSISIPDGVTSIGSGAFAWCTGLTSITIPDGVTSIGSGAFSGCSGLTSITLPDGVTSIEGSTFYECSNLTSITIPEGVTSIGDDAFYCCRSLTSVTLPNGLKSIGKYAFDECSSLASIMIPDGVTSIGDGAFKYCSGLTSITIPNGLKSIGEYAFGECSSLRSITIPAGVTSIGDYAFYYCRSLTSITLPDGVTSIGESAFGYCSSLTSMRISDGVTSIGSGAFAGCSGLTSITIPDGVTSIGDGAFARCTGLTSITIPESVTSIDGFAFSFCSMTLITIPEGVMSISRDTFSNCSALQYTEYDGGLYLGNAENPYHALISAKSTDITQCRIHPDTKVIADKAFADCTALISLAIPDGVISIGSSLFLNCSSLISVTIPDIGTSIDSLGLENCDSLQYNEYGGGLYLGNAENPYLVFVKVKSRNATQCEIHHGTKIVLSGALFRTNVVSITVPVSVKVIGFLVSTTGDYLREIVYQGSIAEWNAIQKEGYAEGVYGWGDTVRCTDGTIYIR